MPLSGRCRRLLDTPLLVMLVVASVLPAAATVGCGGGGDDGSKSPSSSARPSSSATARPDFTTPSVSPSPIGVIPVDVKGDLLVVRGEKDDWAVWSVTPATGAEQRLVDVPFEPGRAAASPDHRYVAYLKAWYPRPGWRRTLAIVDLDGGVMWPELQGTGLRRVNDMTWLSSSELLVSGPVPKGGTRPEDDRLYVHDVADFAWRSFHGIHGTEPSVAVETGDVAFRRVTSLDDDALIPPVEDELVFWSAGAMSGSSVLRETRSSDTPWSVSAQPVMSPDGEYVLVAETGSDSGVRWSLYRTWDGARLWTRNESEAHPLVGAWDGQGRRLAIWGVPASRWGRTTIWVYDVEADRFVKSLTKRNERVLEGLVTGLDWSTRGDLVASTSEGATDTVFIAPRGDPKAFVAVCSGSLPVWIE